jgi:hypothetical protein
MKKTNFVFGKLFYDNVILLYLEDEYNSQSDLIVTI